MDASYSLSWLATPISLYHRRLFNVVLTASTYPILPSIAGGLGFFIQVSLRIPIKGAAPVCPVCRISVRVIRYS
ncbi:hypothetical protein D5281_18525 [bacterium 1xD42-62]|uniref:Uncharacterized protein n=1 Tax=Parablautia muri TaxID=2320879 RepID=A0A9X5BI97_9FIRM|nr:hypothetical protein [Parablautia muri]